MGWRVSISWQFALENFQEVCKTDEFLSIPVFLLKRLLQSENLNVSLKRSS